MSKEAQITAAELKQAMDGEMRELLEETARSLNEARAGAIIADSEELVREAVALFRRKLYERAVQLLADKAAKAAFSPSGSSGQRRPSKEQGSAGR